MEEDALSLFDGFSEGTGESLTEGHIRTAVEALSQLQLQPIVSFMRERDLDFLVRRNIITAKEKDDLLCGKKIKGMMDYSKTVVKRVINPVEK
jgi:hypothetical protein